MSSSAPPPPPSLLPEIGPDGLARESPVIAYTEKIIEEEKLQLRRYIQENYSKIRDVERELESLTLEMKLTSGPKKAALEHLRKKIELATEKIRLAKIKEEEAKKAWEAAAQAVKDEEANKQKLCDDLNQLVQESTTTQFTRLEELKRRLESLSHGRVVPEAKPIHQNNDNVAVVQTAQKQAVDSTASVPQNAPAPAPANNNNEPASDVRSQRTAEVKEKRKTSNTGRGKGNMILPKGRGTSGPGWTGAGFDVDNGT